MRRSALLLALAACGFSTSAFAEGRIIQVEPRPTYGATVSIESGVRVYRPLPAGARTVIVNPSRTPLVIDVGEAGASNQTTTNNVVVDRRRY